VLLPNFVSQIASCLKPQYEKHVFATSKKNTIKIVKILPTRIRKKENAIHFVQHKTKKNGVVNRLLKEKNRGDFECVSSNNNISKDSVSLLHIACENHPPCHIVKLLCQVQPNAVMSCHADNNDDRGQGWYPLQTAIRHGANPDVIEYLINHNPDATKEAVNQISVCLSYINQCKNVLFNPGTRRPPNRL